MRHRATQLILPFEPALPGRQLILAPRLWPTMTPTTQQQLAKRVAQLLRSMLAAADAGDLIGGHHDEHAAQFGKPGDDGASRPAGLIYVRQSTAGQVRQHQESTELQYRLVDRAALFGWPKERIEVIDDDLGKSGTSSDSRGGFQRLIAEIGLGKAGLVLSLDASRLARNNHDWHQLLELCSLFGVLIADGERVYDPCAYHDRLLLGLSGIMSEAELHQIKLRLHQGERQKAARGELRVPLPAGLAYGRDGRIGFNPDEEVHARLLHLFAKFRELRSAKAVMRHFQEANLLLPAGRNCLTASRQRITR